MIRAPPRKNENGEASIRPYRIGTSSGSRDTACSSSRPIGSRRSGNSIAAWLERGTSALAAFPRADRSASVKCDTAFGADPDTPSVADKAFEARKRAA